jgi:hypothetical protein
MVVFFTVILVIVVSILVDLTFTQINDVSTRSVLSNLWQYAAVLTVTLVAQFKCILKGYCPHHLTHCLVGVFCNLETVVVIILLQL